MVVKQNTQLGFQFRHHACAGAQGGRKRGAVVYGSLQLAADGGYNYLIDNADADTRALPVGARVTDVFSYTITDQGVSGSGGARTDTGQITVQVAGPLAGQAGASVQDGGDVLDLRDLLSGETPATLDRFLDFNVVAGATPTTEIRISSSGGFSGGTYNSAAQDQRIVLEGVDIRASLGLAANASANLILQALIDRSKLLVDSGP